MLLHMSALGQKQTCAVQLTMSAFTKSGQFHETWQSQNSVIAKTDEPFTEIFPAVKLRDCTRAIFNALGDFFAISQPALADPFS